MGIGFETNDHRLGELGSFLPRLSKARWSRSAVSTADPEGEGPGPAAAVAYELRRNQRTVLGLVGPHDFLLVVRIVVQVGGGEPESSQFATQRIGSVERVPLGEDMIADGDARRFWKLNREKFDKMG